MATCRRCAAIDFDDSCLYAVGSIGFINRSALAGCPGCKFFLAVAQSFQDENENSDDDDNSEADNYDDSETDDNINSAIGDNDLETDQSSGQGSNDIECGTSETHAEEDLTIEQRPELQVLLQRHSPVSNRVDINFMEQGRMFEMAGYKELRLCTSHGKQGFAIRVFVLNNVCWCRSRSLGRV